MINDVASLAFPDLVAGHLVRRYKRFMADVRLNDGSVITAHCPNSGSMLGCSDPGRPVCLSVSSNPKRRLAYTWELIDMPGSLVCVNTHLTNKVVKQGIVSGLIEPLSRYPTVRTEVKCGRNSRIDMVLSSPFCPDCFVEVKSSTLVEEGVARFPDAKTERGLKHLLELQDQVRAGKRGVIFFLIQRMDANSFAPADDIDVAYGRELRRAAKNGVEILCYDVRVNTWTMTIRRRVPYRL
jgi:sugar fermentation stimulation protein A